MFWAWHETPEHKENWSTSLHWIHENFSFFHSLSRYLSIHVHFHSSFCSFCFNFFFFLLFLVLVLFFFVAFYSILFLVGCLWPKTYHSHFSFTRFIIRVFLLSLSQSVSHIEWINKNIQFGYFNFKRYFWTSILKCGKH